MAAWCLLTNHVRYTAVSDPAVVSKYSPTGQARDSLHVQRVSSIT